MPKAGALAVRVELHCRPLSGCCRGWRGLAAWRTEDEAAKDKYSFGEVEEDGRERKAANRRAPALSEPADLELFSNIYQTVVINLFITSLFY